MAHLTREVEDHVAIADEIIHRRLLTYVRDVHADAAGDAVDIEQIAAVVGDQRIHQQDVRAQLDEVPREIAADESDAAGDHHRAAAVERPIVDRHRLGGLG